MTNYVTIGGNTYSDGSTDEGGTVRNLGNGGHRIYFFPLLNDVMTRVGDAEGAASAAAASEGNAATSESNAADSETAAAASASAAATSEANAADSAATAEAAAAETLSGIAGKVRGGELVNWDLTPSGGTADQPAVLLYTRATEQVRQTITWGTSGGADGNPTQVVHEYSDDSGSTWSTLGTETITYDSSGNVTAIGWG